MRSVLAVVVGAVVGGVVNMGLIWLSPSLIPPPEGVDVTTTEGLKAGIHLFEPRHFIMPFLAHALGTFVGALVACKLAVLNKVRAAYLVGVLFLIGGIAASMMIPAPTWFIALDLLVAYLPMAWLAMRMAGDGSGVHG
jgi:hypothetical protein